MRHIIVYLLLLIWSASYVNAQGIGAKVIKSSVKSSAKRTVSRSIEKKMVSATMRNTVKKEERAFAETYAKRAARHSIARRIRSGKFINFQEFGEYKSRDILSQTSSSKFKSRFIDFKKVSKKPYVANKATVNMTKSFCGKEGFKTFMQLSMKERMINIKAMTKYIYSLPEAERAQILKSMSPAMREKITGMRTFMTSNLPKGGLKGTWKGEKGNSYFVLNDNYVWTDPKTKIKTTVGELRKKYNIKDEIKVLYKDGEPIFDDKIILGKTKVEYKSNYNYKKLKDLHNPINENIPNEAWAKGKLNSEAVNPARDFVENAAVDGTRVSGARNTYHEAWDGETIYVVPDFIHSICTHNGGRSIAALVQ